MLAKNEAVISALSGPMRLRTLTTLRWLAVAGQTAAITVVHFALGFPTPLGLCLAAIAASAWLNLFSVLRFSPQRVLTDREAAAFIAFDITQLCTLLFFTGGLSNPFSALIIAPVTIAASFLSLRYTILIAAVGVTGISLLSLFHMALPWTPGETITISPIYKAGVWAALTFSVLFFAAYAHRIAQESAQMRSALAAAQLVLAREERLAALGGLAAAAAHELGTPLATIQVTAKEMQREIKDNDDLREDAALLVSQAERCRDILSRLARRGEEGDAVHDRLGVGALLKEAADPFFDLHQDLIIRIETNSQDRGEEPVLRRRPEVIFGLRNIIENAVSFAKGEVVIAATWDAGRLHVSVHDDGPGFPPEILTRLGEPYVSARTVARPGAPAHGNTHAGTGARAPQLAHGKRKGSLGLGFFIAKTLLEGTGARIDFRNRQWGENPGQTGASVSVVWPISALKPPVIA